MKHFCSLSEAIREGSKLRQQGFHQMLSASGRTCALGAGAEALGLPRSALEDGCYSELEGIFPYIQQQPICLPATCDPDTCGAGDDQSIADIVVHLNDFHRWPREAIADWLEREEEKLGFVTISITEDRSLSSTQVQTVGVGV